MKNNYPALKGYLRLLRFSLGFVFILFGVLKFFPGMSPAESLASNTVCALTFKTITPHLSLLILATVECVIGLSLFFESLSSIGATVMILHLCCTFIPVFIFPELIFSKSPFTITLEGQYIIKNIVFISAGIMIISANRRLKLERSF